MSSAQKLLADIERFLKRHDMAATTFGVEACRGDRTLVHSLRAGRMPSMATADRIRAYMTQYNADHPRQTTKRRRSKGCHAAA